MKRDDILREARKYKKLIEKQSIIHFTLQYNSEQWWMVEYTLWSSDHARGFSLFSEVDSTRKEKEFILGQFLSFMRTLINIQRFIDPRIAVTKEIQDTLGDMKRIVSAWALNEEDEEYVNQFNQFAELLLWYQDKTNEVYQEYIEVGTRVDQYHTFTVEDNEQLLLIGSKLDLIMYLQVKLQYDHLNANQLLLHQIKKRRNGLTKKDYSYIIDCLNEYSNSEAQAQFKNSLFTEENIKWQEEIVSKNSYLKLLESSIQKYRESDSRRLRENVPLLRN